MNSTQFNVCIGAMTFGALKLLVNYGVFGEKVVHINIDDENPKVSKGFFINTATWDSADCFIPIYTVSWRPIRFERTNDYSALFGGIVDKN